MNLEAEAPLSRTTSRPSARSRNSTLSRNQSLIKKNIGTQDLKPADILIERFVAWKAIVKQLTAYFEGIADIENNTGKELTKLAGVIQVPFRAGNQFLGEGGLQDVFYDIRDKTRIIADHHANLGRTIDSSIVQHLQKLRTEIKAHIKNVQNDTGRLAASVAKERELSTKLVGELANAVSTYRNTPMQLQPKNDPYIANLAVAHQLQRQVLEENLLHKSIIIMQQNSAHFEEGIVRSIQSAWATFDEWKTRASVASQEIFASLSAHLAALPADREWIQFAARSDHLLHPETPLRDPQLINYPLKNDPSVIPAHTGHLERKKRYTRNYTEGYYVLTPAGFLHEFHSSDPTVPAGQNPVFSLFLPSCTLGPASTTRARINKFHIECTPEGQGTIKTGTFRGLWGGEGTKAWSFRARSRDDMMEWWNDIRMLCAKYLVASEPIQRTGPVHEAVRSVGYLSEEVESEEEEEEVVAAEHEHRIAAPAAGVVTAVEGSSVEEEPDVEPTYDHDHPPRYTHPEKQYAGVEMGPHGYVIEKKIVIPAEGAVNYQAHPEFHQAPTLARNQYSDVQSHHVSVGEMPAGDTANVDTGAAPVDPLARRMSKRAMEKAPEGGAHVHAQPQITPMTLAMAPPPVPSTYGQTQGRLHSPPPSSAAKEVHAQPAAGAGALEEDEEGIYAEEEPSREEVERGRGRAAAPAEGHVEHEVGVTSAGHEEGVGGDV
ncbi:hypothetical protein M413DRAFT_449438 [Hebeloma cylindrosporum]|uniref:PH domain-containing protein n=1 Tax=Hebeloma cylindrosporum TaxID=76867 RepID=A0A0C3BX09_HEBCY|nr:hypothetical protein M413DRAFT_449438 [Hebeloma cylindrosporum h7]